MQAKIIINNIKRNHLKILVRVKSAFASNIDKSSFTSTILRGFLIQLSQFDVANVIPQFSQS